MKEEPYLPKQREEAIKNIVSKAMFRGSDSTDEPEKSSPDGFRVFHQVVEDAYRDGGNIFPHGYHGTIFGVNDMDLQTRPNVIKRGMTIPMSFGQLAGMKAPKGHYIQRVPTWVQRIHYLGIKIFFRFAERVIERLDHTPWVSGPGGYEYDPPFLHDFAPRKKFIREEES